MVGIYYLFLSVSSFSPWIYCIFWRSALLQSCPIGLWIRLFWSVYTVILSSSNILQNYLRFSTILISSVSLFLYLFWVSINFMGNKSTVFFSCNKTPKSWQFLVPVCTSNGTLNLGNYFFLWPQFLSLWTLFVKCLSIPTSKYFRVDCSRDKTYVIFFPIITCGH